MQNEKIYIYEKNPFLYISYKLVPFIFRCAFTVPSFGITIAPKKKKLIIKINLVSILAIINLFIDQFSLIEKGNLLV